MPPKDDIADMELDSSTGSEQDVKAPVKADPPAPAESSAAADEKSDDLDLLSVVRDAVKKPEPETASSAEGEEAGDPPADEKASRKAPDDENWSDVPFHKHPRFQELLRSKKAAEADATRYRNVEKFLTDNGLDAGEAAEALTVAALAKSNPVAAWERMQPWVQKLLSAAGVIVPDAIQRRVQAGEMTPAAAAELSRAQAQLQAERAQVQFRQQQEERRRQEEQVNALVGAATAWEADRRLKDPNFDAKSAALQKEVLWLQTQEGRPTTPEGVREQLQKAYKAVSAAVPVAVAPSLQKPAVRPVTGGQVAGTPRASTGEMSTLDIIKRRMGAG